MRLLQCRFWLGRVVQQAARTLFLDSDKGKPFPLYGSALPQGLENAAERLEERMTSDKSRQVRIFHTAVL
jgi:hypothetical protein